MTYPIHAAVTSNAIASCSVAPSSRQCLFCEISDQSWGAFDTISVTAFYPRSTKLFTEGESPKGVFILCGGRAKVLIGSSSGKSLMRVAERGEVLGLSAALSGHSYEGSAEMLDAGEVTFVRRESLLNYLRSRPEASFRVAQHLSDAYAAVHEQMRILALSDSAAERLARLVLCWCRSEGRRTDEGIHLKVSLTHGEMAQMIGSSRETVTRLFSEWRARAIIRLHGSSLLVRDQAALEYIVSS